MRAKYVRKFGTNALFQYYTTNNEPVYNIFFKQTSCLLGQGTCHTVVGIQPPTAYETPSNFFILKKKQM